MPLLQKPVSVLFVCTGNICRSPTAEGVFRHLVREAGLEGAVVTDSAGTHGYHVGDPPDSRSIATARSYGVDLRDLRARTFEPIDFQRFGYLFAMDSGHYGQMASRRPERGGGAEDDPGAGLLSLFQAFPVVEDGAGGLDVPDPYYGTQADFEAVFRMVDDGCARILAEIRARHGL